MVSGNLLSLDFVVPLFLLNKAWIILERIQQNVKGLSFLFLLLLCARFCFTTLFKDWKGDEGANYFTTTAAQHLYTILF